MCKEIKSGCATNRIALVKFRDFYFSTKTYTLTPKTNRLGEMLQFRGHMRHGKLSQSYIWYSSLSGALKKRSVITFDCMDLTRLHRPTMLANRPKFLWMLYISVARKHLVIVQFSLFSFFSALHWSSSMTSSVWLRHPLSRLRNHTRFHSSPSTIKPRMTPVFSVKATEPYDGCRWFIRVLPIGSPAG